jgi:hypothetical protein
MPTVPQIKQMKQAAAELPDNPVGNATRAALAMLAASWQTPHALKQGAADADSELLNDLESVIKNLKAFQQGLQSDPAAANRRMRKLLKLPIVLPPFDPEEHDDWLYLAKERYSCASEAELPELAKELYERYKGVLPPGPLDYTRQ